MVDKIEIPLSKSKLFLGFGGSILFVVLAVWLLLNANDFPEEPGRLLRNPVLIKTVGIIGIFFFGAVGVFIFKKLFDKKAGLIIDSNGITDNSNATSVGLIKWQDISKIRTEQVMSTKFLLIEVSNPEVYIENAKSGMKARLMRTNINMYGTPLSIASNSLKYDFKKLEELIQSEFDTHKNIN